MGIANAIEDTTKLMKDGRRKQLANLAKVAGSLTMPAEQRLGTGAFTFPLPGKMLMVCRTQQGEFRDCHHRFTLIVNLHTPGKVWVASFPA